MCRPHHDDRLRWRAPAVPTTTLHHLNPCVGARRPMPATRLHQRPRATARAVPTDHTYASPTPNAKQRRRRCAPTRGVGRMHLHVPPNYLLRNVQEQHPLQSRAPARQRGTPSPRTVCRLLRHPRVQSPRQRHVMVSCRRAHGLGRDERAGRRVRAAGREERRNTRASAKLRVPLETILAATDRKLRASGNTSRSPTFTLST